MGRTRIDTLIFSCICISLLPLRLRASSPVCILGVVVRGLMQPMSSDLEAVVFDLDGVLIHGSNQGYFDCHAYALASVGLEIPLEEQRRRLLEFWSYPHEFQLGLFISDPAQLKRASKLYEDYLFSDRFFSKVRPVPGATQVVMQLANCGLRLAIATGMHVRQVPIALNLLELDASSFKAIISGYEILDDNLQKPHPYMLNTLLARLQIRNDQGIYIGDSKDDIRMAKAAKVPSVAVLTGNMDQEQANSEAPDYILPSVADLPQLSVIKTALLRSPDRQ